MESDSSLIEKNILSDSSGIEKHIETKETFDNSIIKENLKEPIIDDNQANEGFAKTFDEPKLLKNILKIGKSRQNNREVVNFIDGDDEYIPVAEPPRPEPRPEPRPKPTTSAPKPPDTTPEWEIEFDDSKVNDGSSNYNDLDQYGEEGYYLYYY